MQGTVPARYGMQGTQAQTFGVRVQIMGMPSSSSGSFTLSMCCHDPTFSKSCQFEGCGYREACMGHARKRGRLCHKAMGGRPFYNMLSSSSFHRVMPNDLRMHSVGKVAQSSYIPKPYKENFSPRIPKKCMIMGQQTCLKIYFQLWSKLLACPLITPIILPYRIPYIAPLQGV